MTSGPLERLRLDHIAVAVEDLDAASRQLEAILGVAPSAVEHLSEEGVRLVFFRLGPVRIELLEPASPESPIRRFLDRGRPGLHHIALRAPKGGLASHLARLEGLGIRLAPGGVRQGSGGSRIAFVHPASAAGVLIELCEEPPGGDGAPGKGSP